MFNQHRVNISCLAEKASKQKTITLLISERNNTFASSSNSSIPVRNTDKFIYNVSKLAVELAQQLRDSNAMSV